MKYVIIVMTVCLFVLIPTPMEERQTHAFSERTLQHGATGDDVIELQARLQYIGFYNGNIDGVFGWSTYWALRNFQYEFGIEIDGLLGGETKQKLIKATQYDESFVKNQIRSGKDFTYYGGVDQQKQTEGGGQQGKADSPKQEPQQQQEQQNQGGGDESAETAVNVPNGYSQNDIQLMANAVYGEARGEPYTGQVAVAAVILNRVESSSFPNSVSGVIFEPRAFTAVSDGQIWLTPNEQAKEAVLDAINGWDPSGNALYYFNPVTATSDWIWSRPQIKEIGKHIFCK